MTCETIVDPGYKIVLFLHILRGGAGVWAYVRLRALLLGAAVSAGDAGDPGWIQKFDRYLVNPGMIVSAVGGAWLALGQRWRLGDQ